MLKSKTRVFLVDDHEMILPGLKIAVESMEKFTVIGTATDGLTAFNSIMELSPDIAVLDLSIPVLNGFEITRKLREKKSPVKIIILTSYSEDKYIREAMELKVDGYLLKENSSRELVQALDTVAAGSKYITPKVMAKLTNSAYTGRKNDSSILAADSLTEKEYEVLKLVSEGKRGREICSILNISESTLKTHKSHLMQKLNVSSVNELMLYALKNNIFS
ncbi:MAG TPA: response regulator transcription factor [Spirochaetota bacterium]|nr:response regulator transcription factor [Spirochaetota bacterium]HPJ43551.1 response regulator transcription factor [Spirochaetota bacterium]HPR39096.1 response regulator transcription factor [Spirochaetota bacterium]HRX49531.1 response regulator transcription factor [Spirochaetota bacterium]